MNWKPITAVLGFIVAWELVGRLGWISPVLLSYPTQIAAEGVRLFRSGELVTDTVFTFRIFIASYITAWLVGVTVGFAIGYSQTAHDFLNPFIVVANSLPKIVLMPLIVLWLGIGSAANVFLGALMASFPILMSVRSGVKSLDPELIRLARVYGASRSLFIKRIILPAITPFLLSGMRVAISYGMVGVLIAEFFGANRGLGYRMVLYTANFEVPAFFVCICMVGALTLVLSSLVSWLEKRAESWRPNAFVLPGM